MKAFILLMGLLLAMPLSADIFKCTINGNTSFSDQPCGDNTEIVEIDSTQPDDEAVQSQQAITRQFQEESRVNQVHDLKRKNNLLSTKIGQLQQDRQSELNRLQQGTYTQEDGRMGTRENGLLEQMDHVDAEYQQQIRDLNQQMQKNQQQIHQLYQ